MRRRTARKNRKCVRGNSGVVRGVHHVYGNDMILEILVVG